MDDTEKPITVVWPDWIDVDLSRRLLLLRVKEAAQLCGYPLSTAYALIASGEWPVVRTGRSLRVPLAGLMGWIEEHTER